MKKNIYRYNWITALQQKLTPCKSTVHKWKSFKIFLKEKKNPRGFPGSPEVKTLCFHSWDWGQSWLGSQDPRSCAVWPKQNNNSKNQSWRWDGINDGWVQNEGLVTFSCGKRTVSDCSGRRDKHRALRDSWACAHAVTSVTRAITALTSAMVPVQVFSSKMP